MVLLPSIAGSQKKARTMDAASGVSVNVSSLASSPSPASMMMSSASPTGGAMANNNRPFADRMRGLAQPTSPASHQQQLHPSLQPLGVAPGSSVAAPSPTKPTPSIRSSMKSPLSRSTVPLPIPQYVQERAQNAGNRMGFDWMHRSLKALLDRLDSDNLDVKLGAVGAYLEAYYYKGDSEEMAHLLTKVLDASAHQCSGMAHPAEPNVALSCAVLDRLLHWLVRFQPAMRKPCEYVRNTIFRAVTPGKAPEFAESAIAMDLHNYDTFAAPFMTGLYADAYKEAKALLDTAKVNSDAAARLEEMKGQLSYWKQAYTTKIFTGWRVHVAAQTKMKHERKELMKEWEQELLKWKDVEKHNQSLQAECTDLRRLNNVLEEELKNADLKYKDLESRMGDAVSLAEQLGYYKRQCAQLTEVVEMEHSTTQALREVAWAVLNEVEKEPSIRKDLNQLPTNIPDLRLAVTFYNTVLKRRRGNEIYLAKEIEDLGKGPMMLDGLLTFLHCLKPDILTEDMLQEAKAAILETKGQIVINTLRQMRYSHELVTIEDLAFSKPYSAGATYPVLSLLAKIYEDVADTLPPEEEPPPMPDDFDLDGEEVAKRCQAALHKKWLWRRSARGLTLSTMYDCLDRIRGNTTSRALLRMYLNRMTPEFVSDILSSDTVPIKQTLMEIAKCVEDNFKVISRVYEFYAVLGEGDANIDNETMNTDQFMRLLMDTHVVDKVYLPAGKARDIIAERLQVDVDYEGEDVIIDYAVYLELLLRFAIIRFIDDIPNPVACLQRLINVHIIPKAAKKDRNYFTDIIRQPDVQQMVRHQKPVLMAIFKLYCKPGVSEMKFQEFSKLMKDAAEVDGVVLAPYQIKQVFGSVQQEDDRTEDDSSTLVFHEFVDAVIAAAMVRYPMPWTPLHERVKMLLDNHILPCSAVAAVIKTAKSSKKLATNRLHKGLAAGAKDTSRGLDDRPHSL